MSIVEEKSFYKIDSNCFKVNVVYYCMLSLCIVAVVILLS